MTILKKLLSTSVSVTLFSFLFLTFLISYIFKSVTEKNISSSFQKDALVTIHSIESFIQTQQKVFHFFAQNTAKRNVSNRKKITKEMQYFRQQFDSFGKVTLLQKNNDRFFILADADNFDIGESLAIPNLSDKKLVTTFKFFENKMRLAFFYRFSNKHVEFVLKVDLPFYKINSIIYNSFASKQYEAVDISLIREDAITLYSPNRAFRINEKNDKYITSTIANEDIEDQTYSDGQKISVLSFSKKNYGLKKQKIGLFIYADKASIFKAVDSATMLILSLTSILLLFQIFLSYKAAKGFSQPIQNLVLKAEENLEHLNAMIENPDKIDHSHLLNTNFQAEGVLEIKKLAASLSALTIAVNVNAKRYLTANDELSQFAYRTSHDLKAPILSSQGYCEHIIECMKENDIQEAQAGIDVIKKNLSKLVDLIEDILMLTKVENTQAVEELIDFEELTHDIKNQLSELIKEKKVCIESKNELTSSIQLPKILVKTVFSNFISNAVKYSHPDRESHLHIHLYENKKELFFVFKDNGIGIPMKHQKNMFKMFHRFHPKVSFGSGLGLYILQKVVMKLEGKVTYQSDENGTTFMVTLKKT